MLFGAYAAAVLIFGAITFLLSYLFHTNLIIIMSFLFVILFVAFLTFAVSFGSRKLPGDRQVRLEFLALAVISLLFLAATLFFI